jgi:two-component system LytT family sensor kinase
MSVAHGFPLPWSNVFASTTPRWSVLALTLPIALHLGAWPSLRMRRRRLVLTHATLFLAIAWTYAAVMAWSMVYANPIAARFPWNARVLRSFYNSLPILVACYAAVLLASWALNESRERQRRSMRASQLEAQLQSARLAALRARLQPHFLYNTLNGIAALVYDMRRDEAGAAIEQLSELLHASLRDDDRDTVTLSEEVALAEQYLALQKMRFGDRLTHVTRIEPNAAHVQVPVLLLQPLIENAVVHGLEAGQERLQVTILAHVAEDVLEIRVENDGPTLPCEADPSANRPGVGVAATRARLVSACGDQASLELLARDGGGVVARVRIPQEQGTNA